MLAKRLSYEDGFTYLAGLSQRANRKLREVAAEIVLSGHVPQLPADVTRCVRLVP